MERRKLGRQGLEVSALGLGCMGMSWAYGGADESECIRVVHHALDIGVDLFDTAGMERPLQNERMVGRALQEKRRAQHDIAAKIAWEGRPKNKHIRPGR